MGPKLICIEGNIGAGKSTFMDRFKEEVDARGRSHEFVFLKEPVDEWAKVVDKEGKTILQNMYEDPAKYCFAFQIMVFTSIQKLLEEHTNRDVKWIVCERSLISSRHVFAKMLHEDGAMNDIEYSVYDGLCEGSPWIRRMPEFVIHLEADANTCFERVKIRNRTGEENITLEYLKRCEEYYSIENLMKMYSKAHIIRTDCFEHCLSVFLFSCFG
jgi:deoxyadenosine/deoxycytidine kinase